MGLQKVTFRAQEEFGKGILYLRCSVIVAEALHALLEKANQLGLIKGFCYGNTAIGVTLLQFADDTVIFCDAWLDVVGQFETYFEMVLSYSQA